MKLRKLLRTKAQASSDPRPTMTIEQALTSIAVELHTANKIAQRQLEIMEASQAAPGQSPETFRLIEKLIEPLGAMIGQSVSTRPQVTSAPAKPAPVTKEGDGTRVEQAPGA